MSPATLERERPEEAEGLWAAIGEPSRRRLLDVLLVRGESTPSALAGELPFTRQAVSKHLACSIAPDSSRAAARDGRCAGRSGPSVSTSRRRR